MLMEIEECKECQKYFTFETSQCSQVILKQGQPDSTIIFLPQCPHCKALNSLELPWNKYGIIDY